MDSLDTWERESVVAIGASTHMQTITVSDLDKALKSVTNCQSPGYDEIPNLWLKKLTSTLVNLVREMNTVPKHPEQISSRGVTVLLYKKGVNRRKEPKTHTFLGKHSPEKNRSPFAQKRYYG